MLGLDCFLKPHEREAIDVFFEQVHVMLWIG